MLFTPFKLWPKLYSMAD